MAVPEMLLSGDHGAVERWRREQALADARRRPDLLGATTSPVGEGPRASMHAEAVALRVGHDHEVGAGGMLPLDRRRRF